MDTFEDVMERAKHYQDVLYEALVSGKVELIQEKGEWVWSDPELITLQLNLKYHAPMHDKSLIDCVRERGSERDALPAITLLGWIDPPHHVVTLLLLRLFMPRERHDVHFWALNTLWFIAHTRNIGVTFFEEITAVLKEDGDPVCQEWALRLLADAPITEARKDKLRVYKVLFQQFADHSSPERIQAAAKGVLARLQNHPEWER